MASLEVFNPVASSSIPRVLPATRPTELDGKRIGLYWNYKTGGDVALQETLGLLKIRYPNSTFAKFQGSVGSGMRFLTAAEADGVAAGADVVVATTGD